MMHIIKLFKEGEGYTFCTHGEILKLNVINLPQLFCTLGEAETYLKCYQEALRLDGKVFEYNEVEFEQVKSKRDEII